MIPVYQTKFGGPTAPREQQGNCYAACIASILELTLEEVPSIPATGPDWWDVWRDWLAERGLTAYCLRAGFPEQTWPGYTVGIVPSQRGRWDHAVVCLDGEVVHDPNPNNKPYKADQVTSYEVFAALNPAEVRAWSKTSM